MVVEIRALTLPFMLNLLTSASLTGTEVAGALTATVAAGELAGW